MMKVEDMLSIDDVITGIWPLFQNGDDVMGSGGRHGRIGLLGVGADMRG